MKYKVLKTFMDAHTNEVYSEGAMIDMTVKRATEAEKNLEKYDGPFLERIEDQKKK